MRQSRGWILGVDLGTTNIAAAWAPAHGGEAEVLPLEHAAHTMPAAVFAADTALVVGNAALNLAEGAPERLLRHPKRLSAQDEVALAGRTVPLVQVITAQLTEVLDRARERLGRSGPRTLALTHPEAWSTVQKERLREAAVRAGVPRDAVVLVSEPVAAARHHTSWNGVPDGSAVGVFDFGGGTLDVAVVRVRGREFRVEAARGDNALGGTDLDAALRRWAVAELEEEHPAAARWLAGTPAWSALRSVDESVRRAKESLSEASSAVVTIPAPTGDVRLAVSRAEFERAVSDELDRAVALVIGTLDDCRGPGGRPLRLEALYLTGGSSRVPAVQDRLQAVARVAVLDDPKLVVAKGATLLVADLARPPEGPRRPPAAPPPRRPPQGGPPRRATPPPQNPARAQAPRAPRKPASRAPAPRTTTPRTPAPRTPAPRTPASRTPAPRRGGGGSSVAAARRTAAPPARRSGTGRTTLVGLVLVAGLAVAAIVVTVAQNLGGGGDAPTASPVGGQSGGDAAGGAAGARAALPSSLAGISDCSATTGGDSRMPEIRSREVANCRFRASDWSDPPTTPTYLAWRDVPNAKVFRDWMVDGFAESSGRVVLRDSGTRRAVAYPSGDHVEYYAVDTGSGLAVEARSTFTSLEQARRFDGLVGGG